MVDIHLPILDRPRPLRVLFLDLNSYFASVEQQTRPELRGRPVAVVPVVTDSSSVIASSHEARRFGVKCGTNIGEARRMCPDLVLVDGRHSLYSQFHKEIRVAAESVLPIEEVCSIDEMWFRLLGTEQTPTVAAELARAMKRAIADRVGECMTSSIGIAPNTFLAKLATEMEKPNGLVLLQQDDLPHRLHGLKLTDFAGINRRMKARLQAAGIFTVEQMCAASPRELALAFGSVVGERWWYLLRGVNLGVEVHARKTLGHSHVLPPQYRSDQGCHDVLLRLLYKAAARLRKEGLWTTAMAITVRGTRRSWDAKTRLPPTQDSVTLTEHFLALWADRTFDAPMQVAVGFYDLWNDGEFTPSLFEPTVDRATLSRTVDRMNHRFRKNAVYVGGMSAARDTAEEKIAFAKTELFSEGRGDHEEWVDTRTGKIMTN